MNTIVVEQLVKNIQGERNPFAFTSTEIPGTTQQDKLAHIAAAIWIADQMQTARWDFQTALLKYSEKMKQALK